GLMCIAPLTDDVEEARPFFAEVKAIYDRYRGDKSGKTDFQVLSMGMSNDFEVAVEEGANAIRVGTAIFGARNYRQEEK
ncbi:MAG: YggS family pyridoxal phosphate-dependent enzyme, partial [Firmicutes bacterium]|nr:YggS family pyridoxal phosphate-dependent enzyme [Bacillota bacterium]